MDGYKELAAAIVERALMDYCNLLRNPFCGYDKKELEDFFYSEFFVLLSDGVSADYIIRKIREEIL